MIIKIPNITNNQKLIGVVILILIALFYWFQIRPSQIRSSCAFGAQGTIKYLSEHNPRVNVSYFENKYNEYYQICLHQKGL